MDLKHLAIILIAVLVLNLILFAIGKVNELLFWAIIIVIGITAYLILPKLKKNKV